MSTQPPKDLPLDRPSEDYDNNCNDIGQHSSIVVRHQQQNSPVRPSIRNRSRGSSMKSMHYSAVQSQQTASAGANGKNNQVNRGGKQNYDEYEDEDDDCSDIGIAIGKASPRGHHLPFPSTLRRNTTVAAVGHSEAAANTQMRNEGLSDKTTMYNDQRREQQPTTFQQFPIVNLNNTATRELEDDEDEDDADAEDWNELNELLEEVDGEHALHKHRHELDDESKWSLLLRWLKRFLLNLLLISFVLIPGLLCNFVVPGQCMVLGTGFFYYSIMFTILIFGFFFADALIMIFMVAIKNAPMLGSLFLYYINNISSPLKWTIVSLVFQVTWNAFFLNSEMYRTPVNSSSNALSIGATIQSLITCFTITAIVFLLKALVMRFFAIGFHRAAYYGRIRNSLLTEYVLNQLLTGECRRNNESGAMSRRSFTNKLSSVKDMVSAGVLQRQQKNSLQRQLKPLAVRKEYENDEFEDGIEPKGFCHALFSCCRSKQSRKIEQSAFMLETLPVTKAELLARTPISSYKLAGFVEFIKRNNFSYQRDPYRKAIEKWERKRLGATGSTELNQITVSSMKDLESLMEISDSKNRYSASSVHQVFSRHNNTVRSEGQAGIPMNTLSEYSTMNLAVESLTPTQATRMLAGYIFDRLKQPQSGEVVLEDFIQRMDPEIAVQAFALFDGNWDQALSENEIYTSLLKIARDRMALKTALNDAETAIDKLNTAVAGFCMLVLFVSYFIVFGTDPNQVLLTLSSFLLAVAFAIGSSVKTLLESIIFIFVTHPFDIGDRVIIDKVVYTVTKMSLLSTHLKRYDNALHYFSNSALSQMPILNLRRSPDQFDLITLNIELNTPIGKLRRLEQRIGSFLAKHSSLYYRKFEVEYRDMIGLQWLEVRVWIQHRCNFQNTRRYRERRGRVLVMLKRVCEKLDIRCELPVQRIEPLFSPDPTFTQDHQFGGGYSEQTAMYGATSVVNNQQQFQMNDPTLLSMGGWQTPVGEKTSEMTKVPPGSAKL